MYSPAIGLFLTMHRATAAAAMLALVSFLAGPGPPSGAQVAPAPGDVVADLSSPAPPPHDARLLRPHTTGSHGVERRNVVTPGPAPAATSDAPHTTYPFGPSSNTSRAHATALSDTPATTAAATQLAKTCANTRIPSGFVPGDPFTNDLLRQAVKEYLAGARAAVAKYGKIEHWDVSCVTDMDYLFWDAAGFNADISKWQTGNVVTMTGMFEGATSFNAFIGGWNTGSVTSMRVMFDGASSFNQPIGGWNTASVTTMAGMFRGATSFNQPIGGWNTASVSTMSQMFLRASSFDQPIGGWNTASVTAMYGMFSNAASVNQPIGDWNTAAVTDMAYMFRGATSYDQPIGDWNTTSVTTMCSMFSNAASFNQPIGDWNTAAVTHMTYMFDKASSFNQPIGGWNTTSLRSCAHIKPAPCQRPSNADNANDANNVANADASGAACRDPGYIAKHVVVVLACCASFGAF